MRQATRTIGVLFLAASSVYAAQASGRSGMEPVDPASGVNTGGQGVVVGPSPAEALFGKSDGTGFKADAAVPEAPIQLDAQGPKVPQLREGQPVRAGQVNVSEAGTVEIHVVDANLLEVLRMLAAQSQRNIIASKEVRGAVTANLYDVTIREALDAILHSNGFAYREKGNFIYVYTTKELQEIEKASRKVGTEVFRLFYTPAANAANMIKPVLSDQGQVALTVPATAGLDSGTTEVGGNSHATDDILVITDFPENLDKVREVLKEIDRRPQQILVEATILRASLTEDNALGVDFNVLAGVNFNGVLGSAAQLTGPSLTAPGESTFPTGPLSRGVGGFGTGNNFTQGINNGLRMGFVSDNISVFVAALEGVTDTTVLANPKILALNKQKGEVIVGRKDGYLTTTVTSSSTVQTVEFLDTGTRLIFRPFIGDDGYIRMEVHPEDSSGGLTANSNLPFKITTEVTSNIMVKDGHTVVIGGLFRESSDSSRNQVPLLGNIPLAGNLFRNQRDRTTREEIIILLTPHIIKDDSAYSADSIAQAKDFDKLRVGVRKGMMVTGRERLAEISFEKAQAELARPEPDRAKALWHLDIATNLNPKFKEAIELKEKLTGAELSSVDNSSVRGFVKRRVMAESGMPPSTRPASRRLDEPKAKTEEQPASTLQARSEPVPVAPVAPSVPLAPPVAKPAGTSSSATAAQPSVESRGQGKSPESDKPRSSGLGDLLSGFWNSSSEQPAPSAPSAPVPPVVVKIAPANPVPSTQPSIVEIVPLEPLPSSPTELAEAKPEVAPATQPTANVQEPGDQP